MKSIALLAALGVGLIVVATLCSATNFLRWRTKHEYYLSGTSAGGHPPQTRQAVVIGGGYIGLELGSVYATIGTAVTVVEMMPGLLPGGDRDLVDVLAKRINGLMKSVLLNTRVTKVAPEKKGIRVTFALRTRMHHMLFCSASITRLKDP